MLTKVCLVKAIVFPVVMHGYESWTIKKAEHLKNWCFWTVVLEKTLESPLDCKEIQPVHPRGNQSWIFIRRIDAEDETPIVRPPDAKNWLIGKGPDARKDWRHENGMTEDEMVGWHHWLDEHEFEQAPGVGDGQGSLVCMACMDPSPQGHKESDMTEWLNWIEGTRNSFKWKWSEVTWSCLTFCDPVDCSPPGSSVHGILQERIWEWVAISFSRDLPDPGIEPRSPALQADALPSEPPGNPRNSFKHFYNSGVFPSHDKTYL